MKVLLDTHALVWAVLSPAKLSGKASIAVADEANSLLVSAASAWEIATKVRLGKFPGAEQLEAQFFEVLDAAGFTLLPIEPGTALRAGRFKANHGDPFDRIIAAQALDLDIPVVSADSKLDQFHVRRIW